MTTPIRIGKAGDQFQNILSDMANRHGLIAGATGTGKTVTLQTLSEGFSKIGVPVFMADVKGDLSGMSQKGGGNKKVDERVEMLGLDDFEEQPSSVVFWDVFGEKGHPVRTTVAEMGPLLFSRMLNLNPVQTGVINSIFKIADDQGWLLLDLKDLRSMLQHAAENSETYQVQYGNIHPSSVGAIQRALLQLETEGQMVVASSIFLLLIVCLTHHACMPLCYCGCYLSCLKSYQKLVIWISLSWYFSLMKHTCCFRMRRQLCYVKSSKLCV